MHSVSKNDKTNTDSFEQQYNELISSLSLDQLYQLNEMVIDRIKLLEKIDQITASSAFKRGYKVQWEYESKSYTGYVVRVNQKTITVAQNIEPYRQWKISPNFLKRIP